MSGLGRDEVAHVAALARLALTDEELERYTSQLQAVLEHAEDLAAFDLEGTPPTSHPFASAARVRDDEPVTCLERDEVLAQAPATEDGRFLVPRILGEAP